MTDTRTLKTIVRNLVKLYRIGAFEDMLTYQRAINRSLNRYDVAAVKQAFHHAITGNH